MRLILTAVAMSALVLGPAVPATAAYTSDGNRLFEVDLLTGVTTEVGPYGLEGSRIWNLAISPQGVLYGIDDLGNRLVTIDRFTGQAVSVGSLSLDFQGGDLTFDACGELWFLGSTAAGLSLLTLDRTSGAATLIGTGYDSVRGIAALGERLITANTAAVDPVMVFEIDRQTGALAPVVTLNGVPYTFGADLAFDSGGVLWALTVIPSVPPPPPFGVYVIDLVSGDLLNGVALDATPFYGLAIDAPAGSCPGTPVVDVPAQTGSGLVALTVLIATAGLVFLLRLRDVEPGAI